jgi:hypothetical protein
MSEVKVNTNNTNEVTRLSREESARHEQPDARDVENLWRIFPFLTCYSTKK